MAKRNRKAMRIRTSSQLFRLILAGATFALIAAVPGIAKLSTGTGGDGFDMTVEPPPTSEELAALVVDAIGDRPMLRIDGTTTSSPAVPLSAAATDAAATELQTSSQNLSRGAGNSGAENRNANADVNANRRNNQTNSRVTDGDTGGSSTATTRSSADTQSSSTARRGGSSDDSGRTTTPPTTTPPTTTPSTTSSSAASSTSSTTRRTTTTAPTTSPTTAPTTATSAPTTTPPVTHSGDALAVGFESHPSGASYGRSRQEQDWDYGFSQYFDDHSRIVSDVVGSGQRALRITYPQGQSRGAQAAWKLEPSLEYYLAYDVYFDGNFDFQNDGEAGGKLPGLGSSGLCSGGERCTGTNGFTARYMWRKEGRAQLYLYDMDRGTTYGRQVYFEDQASGADVYFRKGTWHRLIQRVRTNTKGNSDGLVEVWLDGRKVVSLGGLRFRTNDDLVDTLYFSTFFGGNNGKLVPPQRLLCVLRQLRGVDQEIRRRPVEHSQVRHFVVESDRRALPCDHVAETSPWFEVPHEVPPCLHGRRSSGSAARAQPTFRRSLRPTRCSGSPMTPLRADRLLDGEQSPVHSLHRGT